MAIPKRPRRTRKRTTFTDDVVREIRRRLQQGDYQHDIAADLGVNQGRISDVKHGRIGGHVEDQPSA